MGEREADGTSAKKRSQYLPDTFRRRGVYVPYTTTLLRYARLRRPKGGSLEILVPGLAGGTDIYVIPHKVLGDVLNLTVHDRTLHEELEHLRDVSPFSIREVALRVGLTGLGGPGLARWARKEMADDVQNPTMILFNLIRKAIEQLAPSHPGASELTEQKIASPDGMKLARDALGGYASSIGERGDKIYTRLEEWAGAIAAIGSPDGSVSGHLMTLLVSVEGLAAELSKWLIQEPPETAEMAQRTVTAAKAAAEKAREPLKAIDSYAQDMAEPLREFETTERALQQHGERMALMLDGWRRVVDLWNGARVGDRFMQRDTLEGFAQQLPILPEEAAGDSLEMWEALRQSQTRWSRSSQHGMGSDLDQDTKDRLSQFSKEAV